MSYLLRGLATLIQLALVASLLVAAALIVIEGAVRVRRLVRMFVTARRPVVVPAREWMPLTEDVRALERRVWDERFSAASYKRDAS